MYAVYRLATAASEGHKQQTTPAVVQQQYSSARRGKERTSVDSRQMNYFAAVVRMHSSSTVQQYSSAEV